MSKKLNVLFVDDDVNMLQGLRRSLRGQAEKWDMRFLGNAREGLDAMAAMPADIVVSDMRMPEMDGAAFLKEVMLHYPQTVRFVLSGQSDDESIFRSIGVCHQYLAKPCETPFLITKIANAVALRDRMQNSSLRRMMTSQLKIPSSAARYSKLINDLQAEKGMSSKIAADIEKDPGLTALVLQIANSAFFGPARRVSSVSQAVNFLGFDIIRSLALKNDFLQLTFPKSIAGLAPEQIFDHCERTGALARMLARRESLPVSVADDCFAAGLMHDMGKFLLATAEPEKYLELYSETKIEDHLALREHEVLGVTHAEAAGHVLGLWGLPDPVVEAVVFHHDAAFALSSDVDPVFYVFIANRILHQLEAAEGDIDADAVVADIAGLIGDADRAARMVEIVESSGIAPVGGS